MKLTIERAALLKALAHVQSVVERRNTIPILSNVLISAQKGRLSLAATDMDLAITETVDANAAKTDATTAPAHTLYEIVRKLPDTRIRFASANVTLVSKLIDGTFPDYERVIPTGNDKVLNVPCKEFASAVDRVSTISTEKSRAIKLAVNKGVVTLSATSPDAG